MQELHPPSTSSPANMRRSCSTSCSSLRSRARTTSSVLTAAGEVETTFSRQIFAVDIAQLKSKAAGVKSANPLRVVSKTRCVRGTLDLGELMSIASGSGTRTPSLRSLSRTISSEGSGSALTNVNDPWSLDDDLPYRASSSKDVNLTQFLRPKSAPSNSSEYFAHSIDNVHLTSFLPQSPRLANRRLLKKTPSFGGIKTPNSPKSAKRSQKNEDS